MSINRYHEGNSRHHGKGILENIEKQKDMSREVHLTLKVGRIQRLFLLNQIICKNDAEYRPLWAERFPLKNLRPKLKKLVRITVFTKSLLEAASKNQRL